MTSNSVTTSSGSLRLATLRYDIRDKLLRTTNSVGLADSLFATYTGFGHVEDGTAVSTGFTTADYDARHVNSETIEHDAMGNRISLVPRRWPPRVAAPRASTRA